MTRHAVLAVLFSATTALAAFAPTLPRAERDASAPSTLAETATSETQGPAMTNTPGDPTNLEFWKWAITQGGLTLVLLVVFWAYRRDFNRFAAKDSEKIEILTDLVGATQVAITAATHQSASTEKSIHRLARAMEDNRLVTRSRTGDPG